MATGHTRDGLFELREHARIEAAPEAVFDALLDVNAWWPHRLRSGSNVSLEPWVGGRFMEDWGGASGALYGFVTFIERPRLLVVSRPMGLRGAAPSSWTIELDRSGVSATTVRIHHAVHGEVDTETQRSFTSGWQSGLEALARACAERRDRAPVGLG